MSRFTWIRDRHLPAYLVAAALVATAALSASAAVSPGPTLLPTSRYATPAGTLSALHVFPSGAAVSPDGATIVAIAGQPEESAAGTAVLLQSFDAGTHALTGTVRVADAFQSIRFAPDGGTVYVAGGSQQVVHVLPLTRAGIRPGTTIAVAGFIGGLALSRDGRTLWAAASDRGQVTRIDVTGVRAAVTVAAPGADQLALSPQQDLLYASDWRGRQVTAVSTALVGGPRPSTSRLTVGDHPEGIAVLPDGTVVVADANDDTLATIAPGSSQAVFTDLRQVGLGGDAPSALTLGPDGRLYVVLAADDAVAVLSRSAAGPARGAGWQVDGLIPTAWYPTDVSVTPDGTRLEVTSGKGLGSSNPGQTNGAVDPSAVGVDATYLTAGALEEIVLPTPAGLAAYTGQVRSNLRRQGPAALPVVLRPHGPIKHVVYITRENKTYDADLGDLHPGPGAALTLFGQTVTPNLHQLESGFVEAQNLYYPGWTSNVGHMWEDAGGTSDLYEREVDHDASDSSWSNLSNYPRTGLLVQQVHNAGLSVRTYNEELAQQSKLVAAQFQAPTSVFPNYDLAVSDTSRERGWEGEFAQFEAHRCTGVLAVAYGRSCQLPALQYVYLGEDHTTAVDQPGYPTIEAQVADNDYATARVVDAVSHSPDWQSTLVIVVEDDGQGTGDVRSAYHGFLAMASPWVKRGFVSTVPYSLPCVVAAIDKVLGLAPLTDNGATCNPLADMFTDVPDSTPFSADGAGIARYPFVALPGVRATSDPAHGIFSFVVPDATNPALLTASQGYFLRHRGSAGAPGREDQR